MGRFVSLLFICLCFLTGCETVSTLVNNVPEREANEIIVLLSSKGIPAHKTAVSVTGAGATTTEPMWDVAVPGEYTTQAISILNQAGLPRMKGTTLLDLFGAPGIVPSDLQDRIRYQEGLSQQLAGTIRKMDGVIDANVQVVLPRDEETTQPLTASVYVKHRGILDASNNLLIAKIKRYVSSSIPGLTPENVSVVSDRAVIADISLPAYQDQTPELKNFVSIWDVAIARESASRFRFIFYAFIFLLFVLASLLVFFIWKFYPLLKDMLDRRSLFSLSQITHETVTPITPIVENEEM